MTVLARALGRKRDLVPGFGVPLPPELSAGGRRVRLRDLIAAIVRHEVIAFEARQQHNRLLHALTANQIADAAQRGKVSMGGSKLDQPVDEEQAVGAALQAFEDGLYLVILDGSEQRELDAEVFPRPDSEVVFVRLTLLAGA